jgi:hypothetical protein
MIISAIMRGFFVFSVVEYGMVALPILKEVQFGFGKWSGGLLSGFRSIQDYLIYLQHSHATLLLQQEINPKLV